MQDNLPELRDIHLPFGVSMFPPAVGWWVILLGIILIFVAAELFVILRKKSKKRFALKLLNKIDANNIVLAAKDMSEILRRICVFKYKEAAALTGNDWVKFLNSKGGGRLIGKTAQLLINAPYIAKNSKEYSIDNVRELRAFCLAWIGDNL